MGGLRLRVTAAVAVLVVAAAVAALVAGHGSGGTARARAQASARTFLLRYVEPGGRVVRRDQGGDTVSEGQAYGLLAAVIAGDRDRFDRIWTWTRTHLQRPDGLLAWHWQGGGVVDGQPAADADVDAAHALLLGAHRFGEPALARVARRMGRAVRAEETRRGVLVAGPWAQSGGTVDPSYLDPTALRALGLGDVARASRTMLGPLLRGGHPPPDWAAIGPPARAIGAPGGGQPAGYGFDAARLPVRLAASCDAGDRRVAAGFHGLPAAAPVAHPVFTVAQAAQAQASGRPRLAEALLAKAAAQDRAAPTYYGAAWVMLGRAMLTTDLLGGCGATQRR